MIDIRAKSLPLAIRSPAFRCRRPEVPAEVRRCSRRAPAGCSGFDAGRQAVDQLPQTGGEDGIQNVPRGRLFGIVDLADDRAMYYFVVGIAVAGVALIHRVVNSPFGEVLKAIRDNELRATSLGYDVNRYKLMAFALSATLAGVAGATKALVLQVATLSDVHWHASGEVVLMTLLGGMGTLFGPVVGASLVVTLQNSLAGAGAWSTVVIGLVFMACVLAFRRGIVSEVGDFFQRLRRS